jgi:hypothetical protein
MAFNATEFYNELIRDSKLTDEQKTALQSALNDQAVARRLEEGQLRQSDYSRQVAEAQARVQEALALRQQLVEWQKQEQARLDAAHANISTTDEGTNPTTFTGITKDEWLSEKQKMEQGAIGLLSVMNRKSFNYFKEFGEELDTDAVLKTASQNGVNFEIAYDLYTKPRRDEKAAKELEERIKRERTEAAAEALANAQIPTGSPYQQLRGGDPHPLDLAAQTGQKFGWRAAVEAHTKDIMAGTVKSE